ncbi:hypothetical protein HPB49_008407 [Dermacentor silvarum]|uniref:Uncharacterized protein n=1 Tax=Dermacentor silvarum TaxID=543639 RepID=A0ACB8DX80_DERSI|nr:hypothetical protein HPB49_008407 [Dermacentor silvarum]
MGSVNDLRYLWSFTPLSQNSGLNFTAKFSAPHLVPLGLAPRRPGFSGVLAGATTAGGYDPTSVNVVTMETASSDQVMPSEHEYLADMVKLWQLEQMPGRGSAQSVTSLPMAQRLLGDIHLPVGDQQLPFRGHAKASGEICRGVITIHPAETPQRIKSELEWSQGTILAVRKLGESTAAVVTFEGTNLPGLIFYHSVVAYVHPYKKTIPACFLCGTIGHRPSASPPPTPGRCARCGSSSPSDSGRPSSTPM